MKKTVLLVGILVLVVAFNAFGQDGQPWPDRSGKRSHVMVLKDAPPVPPSDWFLGFNNAAGDVGIVFSSNGKNSFAPGVGMDIVTWKNLITLRGEAFLPSTTVLGTYSGTLAGPAILVNLKELATQATSIKWLLDTINPSVGVAGLWDFNNNNAAWAPMISVINIKF